MRVIKSTALNLWLICVCVCVCVCVCMCVCVFNSVFRAAMVMGGLTCHCVD